MYSFLKNYGIIRDRKRKIKMKVNIYMTVQYDQEIEEEKALGIYQKQEEILSFFDQYGNKMCFYFQDRLLIRNTKESIFSYDFKQDSHLEIYLKEYRKGTRIAIQVLSYQKKDASFEVTYQIEGNDFFHKIRLEWEMKA